MELKFCGICTLAISNSFTMIFFFSLWSFILVELNKNWFPQNISDFTTYQVSEWKRLYIQANPISKVLTYQTLSADTDMVFKSLYASCTILHLIRKLVLKSEVQCSAGQRTGYTGCQQVHNRQIILQNTSFKRKGNLLLVQSYISPRKMEKSISTCLNLDYFKLKCWCWNFLMLGNILTTKYFKLRWYNRAFVQYC